jgi:hypothetical protein
MGQCDVPTIKDDSGIDIPMTDFTDV